MDMFLGNDDNAPSTKALTALQGMAALEPDKAL